MSLLSLSLSCVCMCLCLSAFLHPWNVLNVTTAVCERNYISDTLCDRKALLGLSYIEAFPKAKRESPGKLESTNLSFEILGTETGRIRGA